MAEETQPDASVDGTTKPETLTQIMSSALALVSFAVVCFSGLLQGHSFASVIKGSLVALVVGAAIGVLAATVVRVVATENFNKRIRGQETAESPPNGADNATGAAETGAGRTEAARGEVSGTATTAGN